MSKVVRWDYWISLVMNAMEKRWARRSDVRHIVPVRLVWQQLSHGVTTWCFEATVCVRSRQAVL